VAANNQDEGNGAAPNAVRGAERFATALRLSLACLTFAVLLQILLYVRPAPQGGPYLAEWPRYFWLALYYEMLGVWLVASPFFLLWLLRYRREAGARRWSAVAAAQAGLMTLYIILSAVDHEIMRFLGVRLNPSFLWAYARPEMLADGLFLDVLRADRGGPWLPLLFVLAFPAVYLGWALRLLRRPERRALPLWLAILLALAPLLAPANGWRMATSQFRLRKVEPVVLAFAADILAGYEELSEPPDLVRLAAAHQRAWFARSTDPDWRFPDPERPYLRVPTTPAPPPERPWNVIYLQLESLRGADTGFLRPDLARSPTPNLDRLAHGPNAAAWARALSFGMPSINGLFATHCSVMPPTRRYVTALTHVQFLCLPELLRRRGYRAEMFHAADTDWDNSSFWIARWYDRLWRYPQAGGRDRIVFREAAARIRALGRSGRPFLATIVSATNHTPFTSVEPESDVAGHATSAERILNTTHYTDNAVGELIESLRAEPWFDRTLIVVTGDHGFNAGEHGQAPGRHNLYRESVWVPLIIAGPHPRLPAGLHGGLVSHLDLAPTLADLLGLREAVPWLGHSLLAVRGPGGIAFGFRDSRLTETGAWTALRDPGDGRLRLYRGDDWLQQRDRAALHPALAQRLIGEAERARRLNDFLLAHDRIWRPPPAR
jgi:hypothetical protein